MSHYRRANTTAATYFFTVVTYQRRNFLCDDDVRAALREAIIKVRERHPFQIDAWVLLPDHLHAIWALPPGDANFALRWQQIKRYVTQQCGHRLHKPELINESNLNIANPHYGNGDIGNTRSEMKQITSAIWIMCITTQLNTAW